MGIKLESTLKKKKKKKHKQVKTTHIPKKKKKSKESQPSIDVTAINPPTRFLFTNSQI